MIQDWHNLTFHIRKYHNLSGMYKHLFFDLDNTIWDFDLNSYYALREVYVQYSLPGQDYDHFFSVYNRHNDRLWELYRKHSITKQELASTRFQLTFGELGINGPDAAVFNREYLDQMPLQTRLCDGAREILEVLSRRYQMHIITNGFVEVQYKKLENSGLRTFFKNIFISEEVKSPKPDPEIFQYALKSSNARRKESLMIGDSWEVDILGAMGAGLDQVHYSPNSDSAGFTDEEMERVKKSSNVTHRIQSLHQLPEILRKMNFSREF